MFDNRVTVRHDLSAGEFDLCHACRAPLSVEDRQSEHYAAGISCPHCWDTLSEKTRAGARERQKQIELARQRNQPHPIGRDRGSRNADSRRPASTPSIEGSNEVARLIYVMDPMCSWCWGFAPVLQGLAEQAAEHGVPLVLRVGGLRREQVAMDEAGRSRTLSYWQAVHAATGQSFDFDTGLPAGLIYDTEPACRALVAARGLDESRVWPLSLLIQRAFYQQARDVRKAALLVELAERPGSPRSASPKAMTTRPPRPKRQRISAGSRILVSPGSRPCSPSTRASWPCSPMAISL